MANGELSGRLKKSSFISKSGKLLALGIDRLTAVSARRLVADLPAGFTAGKPLRLRVDGAVIVARMTASLETLPNSGGPVSIRPK